MPRKTDWNFLGEDAGRLLKAADRLRRGRVRAERAAQSGDPERMREALTNLEQANREAKAAVDGGPDDAN